MKVIDSKTSKKISVIMFLSCICVVFYHGADCEKYNLSKNFISDFTRFLINIWYPLCQSFAMPFFLMCSGALFYKNINEIKDTRAEIKKRIRSILIPFFVWNLIWTIFSMIISKISFISNRVNGLPIFEWTFKDLFYGIFLYKFNGVMWYLLYIFIFSFISPIIFKIFKNKKIGISFIILIFIVSSIEKKIFNSYNIFLPFLFYIIGAYIMIHKYLWVNKHFSKCTSFIFIIIFLTIIISSTFWRPENMFIENILYLLTRILCVISIWIGLDYFINDNIKIKKYMGYYFFTYLFHFIPGLCLNKVFEMLLPNNWWGLLLNKYFGCSLILLLSIFLGSLLERILPNCYNVLTGNRK